MTKETVYKFGGETGIKMERNYHKGELEVYMEKNGKGKTRMILMTENLRMLPHSKENSSQLVSDASIVKYLLQFDYYLPSEWDKQVSCCLAQIQVYEIRRIDIIDGYIECIHAFDISRNEYLQFYSNIQKEKEPYSEDTGISSFKKQLLNGLLGNFYSEGV